MRNLLQEHFQASAVPLNNKQIESISPDEELSRFIFSSNELTNSGIIKAAAFLPNASLKTSVFRKSRMSPDEYNSKKAVVAKVRAKPIKAVALIRASSVLEAKLQINPEETEHRWHAGLINWPENKEERKSIAQILANAAYVE